jgi:hypothetical protein
VIVAPKDEAQLVDKLNVMLNHIGDYDQTTIRQEALNICSPEVIGEKWMEVYGEATGNLCDLH